MANNEPTVRDRQWMLTLLPAFPLILLVLRVWYLSRQDLQTMLLLVQNVNPIGLISTLIITLLWTLPVMILVGCALGAMLRVSAPGGSGSWLVRMATRTPVWVVAFAGMLAALIWQLRFLPALAMILLMILGLEVRSRYPARTGLIWAVCVLLPLLLAVAAYLWFIPAIAAAISGGELVTTVLLLLPPGLTLLLTGPIPARAARPVINTAAICGALLSPLVVAAIFLRAPVLPTVAIEVDARPEDNVPAEVVIGEITSIDDSMTTMLDHEGGIRFLPNDRVVSRTLCPDVGQPPYSEVDVHGWQVERTALNWLAPAHPARPPDPRCQGRPLQTPE